MAGYKPIKITGFETGLVQERQQFLLVEDGFPVLENAYVWREKVLKKRGKEKFGRLRRIITAQAQANTTTSPYTITDILTSFRTEEPNAEVQCGSAVITFDSSGANETILEDALGDGNFALQSGSGDTMDFVSGTINYISGAISIIFNAIVAAIAVEINYKYYPCLPVMGIRPRELNNINAEITVAFDTRYAYENTLNGAWQELLTGTTWTGDNDQFFWTTNYWVNSSNVKLFWVTNFTSGASADPMRYYDGTVWTGFSPLITATDTLYTSRMLLPFRGRLLAINTWEGTTAGGSGGAVQQRQRIRWSQIGTPIDSESWRQDIRGKGSFLDIPTSENIVSAGFVRDNLVIYCERSTWQLRYIGRDISPFQIEKINSELGAESTFSAVQFDKSLVGIGDKRIVSCDSFDSEPIDIKIPDFAINIENENSGPARVYGVRDIAKRLVYWTYPSTDQGEYQGTYPNRVLLYNYENKSWSILKDSVTVFGYVWLKDEPTWEDLGDMTWEEYDQAWSSNQKEEPEIVSGNQKGYIHKFTELTSNQGSLNIGAISGNVTTPTTLTVLSHNLSTGDIVEIVDIPDGTGYASLNDGVYMVDPSDADTLALYTYNSDVDDWINPQLDASATYVGCGELVIRDNFRVLTKKFNHLDSGQKIQIGYMDVLTNATPDGQMTVNMYTDYSNIAANNGLDTFVNTAFSTSPSEFDIPGASSYMRRVFSTTRGNFVQAEFTLSNSQMNTDSAISEVVIQALIVWQREGGRLTI